MTAYPFFIYPQHTGATNINTQDIIHKAIEDMKTSGHIRPIVYIELDEGIPQVYPIFNFVGDAREKAHLLFTTGREAGQRNTQRELVETCFVTEIWLTQGQPNPNPGMRPPANIPQKEGIMFAIAKNNAPFKTLIKVYEIKRDKKQIPIELAYERTDPNELIGVAFIAGWRSRVMSNQEVAARQPQGMRALLN